MARRRHSPLSFSGLDARMGFRQLLPTARVLRRFDRVNRKEPSPRDNRLGLAIAHGFVLALGGTIEARTPGIGDAGTRMLIHLPLAASTASA